MMMVYNEYNLADRIYALRDRTGLTTRTLLDTYLAKEQQLYAREFKQGNFASLENHTLNIMERYASIQEAKRK